MLYLTPNVDEIIDETGIAMSDLGAAEGLGKVGSALAAWLVNVMPMDITPMEGDKYLLCVESDRTEPVLNVAKALLEFVTHISTEELIQYIESQLSPELALILTIIEAAMPEQITSLAGMIEAVIGELTVLGPHTTSLEFGIYVSPMHDSPVNE